jgi:glyoxylase I family protein
LPVIRRWDDDAGGHRATWVSLGDSFLAIERAAATGPTRADDAPGLHCVALTIAPADRDALAARLSAAGHPVERESAYTLYCRDPDRNLIAFSHYPDARA